MAIPTYNPWANPDGLTPTIMNDIGHGGGLFPKAQVSPDLTVAVSAGRVNFISASVNYAGGNSPAITAPSANPYIAILTINTSGTLAWVYGAEAGSPTAPDIPYGVFPICEVYCRVGMAHIDDTDDTTNGYILNDIRTPNICPDYSDVLQMYPGLTGKILENSADITYSGSAVFGSTDIIGRDITLNTGVMMTAAGTNQRIFCRTLTLSTPSVITGAGIGASGGANGNPASAGSAGQFAAGGGGEDGTASANAGAAGGAGLTNSGGAGGTDGSPGGKAASAIVAAEKDDMRLELIKYGGIDQVSGYGAGGGGGRNGGVAGGQGGDGGAAILIFCRTLSLPSGAYIKADGNVGVDGSDSGVGAGGGGGAGGSAGTVMIFAETLSGTGTVQAVGGGGGRGGNSTGSPGAGGGAGGNGGFILICTQTRTNPFTLTVTGGTGGSPGTGTVSGGTGGNGNAGATEYVAL